jgi:hypothetical protein
MTPACIQSGQCEYGKHTYSWPCVKPPVSGNRRGVYNPAPAPADLSGVWDSSAAAGWMEGETLLEWADLADSEGVSGIRSSGYSDPGRTLFRPYVYGASRPMLRPDLAG